MNDSRTDGSFCAETVPTLHHTLDCALRNERDATRRMQLGLRMGMEREGSAPNYKARQDLILGPKPRVMVKAGRG